MYPCVIFAEFIENAFYDLQDKKLVKRIKYNKLYQMIVDSIDNNISDNKIKSIMDTLLYSGIDTTNMSKPELLFEYSKLY